VESVQADQTGSFRFGRIKPGEYQIAAWPEASESQVRGDELWRSAGPAARRFPVEAGSEIDITLTAVE
jgi:hypothetical protein